MLAYYRLDPSNSKLAGTLNLIFHTMHPSFMLCRLGCRSFKLPEIRINFDYGSSSMGQFVAYPSFWKECAFFTVPRGGKEP